jgi:hypothetical protein
MTLLDDGDVHHAVLTHLVDHGYAPNVPTLAAILSAGSDEVEASLQRLHEGHGLVLHPNSHRIWIAHPFATAPTNFWVTSPRGRWWGNCAWCSLGVAALIGGEVAIATTLGGEEERVVLHVRDGHVVEKELVVHFSLPPARAWENVVYYCSTVLLFRDAEHVAQWCDAHAIVQGVVVPVAQVWELAKVWYGRHLDRKWRKWTTDEAQEIFDRVGLTGEFWALPRSTGRF